MTENYDGNALFNPSAPTPTVSDIVELSSRNLDPSNMHTFYQHHPSTHHWTQMDLENKLDAEGTVIRNKSCLVTKGYSQ